jgi:isopenicillin-N epimerase
MKEKWLIDPSISYLNHGSFGACPLEVLRFQRELQEEMEREAVQFMLRRLEPLLDESREKLAGFIGAKSRDLAFVINATMGVNAVLRSLEFKAGDELLTTSQAYNACANVLQFVAEKSGACVVVADVPFPIASEEVVIEAVMNAVTPRTKLLLLDHITSPTGVVLPVERIIREMNARGIDTLVDGAHAAGMVDLNLETLGAAYYTGNCHKWLCAPKGAAFLWVRDDRQRQIRPTSISHGANSPRTDRSRYLIEFDWPGTQDFTPFIAVGKAIDYIGSLLPGGWPEVRTSNREKVLRGRDLLCEALQIAAPAPDSMIGSLASVPLPDSSKAVEWGSPYFEPLQEALFEKHHIEVPVMPWPEAPKRLLRISAQLYNEEREYVRLAEAVREELRIGD